MIAKSKAEEYHLTGLQKIFKRLRKYDLNLNPNKCVFGATDKLLRFIVSRRGIEIDPSKIKAITGMPTPKTKRELEGSWDASITLVVSLPN